MKTKIFHFLSFLLLSNVGYSQNSTAFQDDMNLVFQVNRSYVSTGLLKDYGLQMTDVAKFNGSLQATNMVNRDVWQVLYSSLYLMKFNTNATLATPASVNTTIASYAATIGGRPVNNIMALHYNYEQFKTNAATGNLVYVQNGKIYDRANRPTTPYEIKTAFSMAPVLDEVTGGTQVFRFQKPLKPNPNVMQFASLPRKDVRVLEECFIPQIVLHKFTI